MAKMGRRTIFGESRGPKNAKNTIQGVITNTGATQFERARGRLATLVGWAIENVSDADTIEYLSRGHKASAEYIAKHRAARNL
jgi:hypothetical protein